MLVEVLELLEFASATVVAAGVVVVVDVVADPLAVELVATFGALTLVTDTNVGAAGVVIVVVTVLMILIVLLIVCVTG